MNAPLTYDANKAHSSDIKLGITQSEDKKGYILTITLGIDIYFVYGNNANTVYFDGAQLYKEEFGTSYQYDSKGNIISSVDLARQNSTFQYNGNDDLMTAMTESLQRNIWFKTK